VGILGREEDTIVVNAAEYAALRAERDELQARIDKVLSDAGLLSSEQIVDILGGNDAI